MAAPNIVNVATITGKTDAGHLLTSSDPILTNSGGSGKVFKINTLIIANVDGTNNADVSVYHNNPNISPTRTSYIANTITVPAKASLVAISKDAAIYLQEGESIYAFASANGDLDYVISYEELS